MYWHKPRRVVFPFCCNEWTGVPSIFIMLFSSLFFLLNLCYCIHLIIFCDLDLSKSLSRPSPQRNKTQQKETNKTITRSPFVTPGPYWYQRRMRGQWRSTNHYKLFCKEFRNRYRTRWSKSLKQSYVKRQSFIEKRFSSMSGRTIEVDL